LFIFVCFCTRTYKEDIKIHNFSDAMSRTDANKPGNVTQTTKRSKTK
jgi:hypothetical protein